MRPETKVDHNKQSPWHFLRGTLFGFIWSIGLVVIGLKFFAGGGNSAQFSPFFIPFYIGSSSLFLFVSFLFVSLKWFDRRFFNGLILPLIIGGLLLIVLESVTFF